LLHAPLYPAPEPTPANPEREAAHVRAVQEADPKTPVRTKGGATGPRQRHAGRNPAQREAKAVGRTIFDEKVAISQVDMNMLGEAAPSSESRETALEIAIALPSKGAALCRPKAALRGVVRKWRGRYPQPVIACAVVRKLLVRPLDLVPLSSHDALPLPSRPQE
jgi:hypothetical protein